MRARELGIVVGNGTPGPHNAITDVGGVRVGYVTLIRGEDVRTGLTLILPGSDNEGFFAGTFRLNGNGEMTGLQYVYEMGILATPVGITNTHSIGAVHEGVIRESVRRGTVSAGFTPWALPVVAETWDGRLNDINGFHVRPEHVRDAFEDARDGVISEGNVGGGTGMICHGFKGGTGTASRVLEHAGDRFVVGVLVQANHGRRERLRINGVAVGEHIGVGDVPLPGMDATGAGSIIVVVATDAPLLPLQCDRLANRAALGIGRTGGLGEDSSGDLVLAFATGNRLHAPSSEPLNGPLEVRMLPNSALNPFFEVVVEATEEAIVNALVAAETMRGRDGGTAQAIPHERLRSIVGV
ncbi:MAG: P1 family peptidase [Chloroflexota bacterium]